MPDPTNEPSTKDSPANNGDIAWWTEPINITYLVIGGLFVITLILAVLSLHLWVKKKREELKAGLR